jgi:hypothetical protein
MHHLSGFTYSLTVSHEGDFGIAPYGSPPSFIRGSRVACEMAIVNSNPIQRRFKVALDSPRVLGGRD